MAYVKNYAGVWVNLPTETTPITAAALNNLETQYDEAVADAAIDATGKITTHSALTTGVHGVTGTVAELSDIAVDANLSIASQDAISKKHTQNTDTHLGAQDADLNMNTHKITGVVNPAAAQDAATKNYVDTVVSGGMTAGMIMMWYGNKADCPAGWHICDGADGTPDFRSRVPMGAAVGAEPGGTGGVATHTHDTHAALAHSGTAVETHPIELLSLQDNGTTICRPIANYGVKNTHSVTQPNSHAISAHSNASNLPPYRTLHFIIKI